jgi:hypothetical protein
MHPAEWTAPADQQAEFDRRYKEAQELEAKVPVVRTGKGEEVIWVPMEGSQSAFLRCQLMEVLFHGTRGPGKTDSLLMSFAQHVGRGHGAAWRGIIFRNSYPQLADVQAKSEKWFRRIFGDKAKFNRAKMMWEWDTGEVLLLRHMNAPSDYWNYHGHEYPFIGWEELTNWPTDECYKIMISCCRSSTAGVPRMIRATTNPYGVGHTWVKDRWRLAGNWWRYVIIEDAMDTTGRPEPVRAAIYGHIDENKALLAADPNYKQTIIASAANPAMAEAWLMGSWDIVAGGMFGDIWNPKVHLVDPFPIPLNWRIDRSFDWGSSRPFSVGWWAESDGSDVRLPGGGWRSTVRGDLFRIQEWYGWTGKPNEGTRLLASDIARGIRQREANWKLLDRVKAGPADSSIFDAENGNCIATDMAKKVRLEDGREVSGVLWTRADKRPGSRKTGWEQLRRVLANAERPPEGVREAPGLFVFRHCEQFIRTFPSLPRDEKDPDDVDSKVEDHIGDEARYRVRQMNVKTSVGRTTGHY